MRESLAMPAERILRFIHEPESDDFESLLREAEGADAAGSGDDLYRAAVTVAVAARVLPGAGRFPVLGLAASRADGGSRLVDELLTTVGDDAGARPVERRGVDPRASRSWLAARQRDRRAVLVIGPERGLTQLVGPLARRGLKFRLPAGSSIVAVSQTGEMPAAELRETLVETLCLAPTRLWIAWEISGVATPLLARWQEEPAWSWPHWMRAEVVGPGRVDVVDLVNLGGPLRVETEIGPPAVAPG